jgi:hypothetical protein
MRITPAMPKFGTKRRSNPPRAVAQTSSATGALIPPGPRRRLCCVLQARSAIEAATAGSANRLLTSLGCRGPPSRGALAGVSACAPECSGADQVRVAGCGTHVGRSVGHGGARRRRACWLWSPHFEAKLAGYVPSGPGLVRDGDRALSAPAPAPQTGSDPSAGRTRADARARRREGGALRRWRP